MAGVSLHPDRDARLVLNAIRAQKLLLGGAVVTRGAGYIVEDVVAEVDDPTG